MKSTANAGVHHAVGKLWKSLETINKIPVYQLKPEKLGQLIMRAATVKSKDLATMVASLEAAKKLELIKYCYAMGIIP